MTIMITSRKKDELAETIGKAMHYAKKAMECVEALDEGEMGERYSRMGMREDDDDDMGYGDRWEAYGDRRGVRGTGRYSRYRR